MYRKKYLNFLFFSKKNWSRCQRKSRKEKETIFLNEVFSHTVNRTNMSNHSYLIGFIEVYFWYVILMRWSYEYVCEMIRIDEHSWYFFMSFFVSVFESMFVFFVRKLCLIFFTIVHVLGFSSSCMFVSSCLVHTASVISDDLNFVSVQCIVEFFM